MKHQSIPSLRAKRNQSLSRAIAEQLEDRRLLAANILGVQSPIMDPLAAPADTPVADGPTVVTAAAATPSPVTGASATLSVLGDDAAGESTLTYTWATIGTPPAGVGFSINGTNAAKNTVVTFTKAGTYTFQVTLTDASALTAISSVSVTVNQTATSIAITSADSTVVATGSTTQLSATELDQFGIAMTSQPAFTWSMISGTGSVNASGLYTAPAASGSAVVEAADGSGVSGSIALSAVPLLAWYQANATSGTTLVDSSGNNQTATLAGYNFFNTGYIGNAINFHGGYATLPAGIVSSLNDFTIAAWVNIPTLSAGAPIFDFGTGTNDYMYLTADSNATGGLTFGITTDGQASEQQVNGPTLSGGSWEHIAVTLSGSVATLYINGAAVAAATITLTPSSLGNTALNYLGKSQFSTDPSLIGAVDDFRIYGAALSAQQLQQVASLSIPTGYSDSDVGSPTIPGNAWFDSSDNVWTLGSSGADISGNTDQFNFASTPLSGDLVLTAEVTSVGDSSQYAQGGLMIRSSLASDAASVSLLMTPSSGIELLSRTADGEWATYTGLTGITGPVWLQLVRYGTTVGGYFSNDDQHWYQVDNGVSLSATDPVLAGLVATSHGTNTYNEVTFTGVSITPNAAPTIVDPATAASTNVVGRTVNLSVLAADDAGEQNLDYTWVATGTVPSEVFFSASGTNSAKVTQAIFTGNGIYNLTAIVTDADGYAVESTVTVNVSIPPSQPVGVDALWSGASVGLSWQAVSGGVSYNIYRSTSIGGEGSIAYATGITATSFVDSNVTAGTNYYYQVTAVDSDGLESARSFEVAAMASVYSAPIISEFMASNDTTLADVAGDYPDWLELYNPTSSTLTLTGDYLTDTTKTLNRWSIPSAALAPGAFLVVFADSANDIDSAGAFHTNFNIGASGGYLALVASDGTTVLSSYTYTQQVADIAYGTAMSQYNSTISYGGVGFLTPTPGAVNGPVIATAITTQPTYNFPSGFYSNSFVLQIATATTGASIYYTLDGTAPSATNGTLYTGPITISGQSDILAMAVGPQTLPSAVVGATYIYTSQVITQAANGQAPAGWPVDWGFSVVHYGMDPAVVDNPAYSSEIAQDLQDLPSVSLTMNLQDLFDPETGIYSESQNSQGVDRMGAIGLINPDGTAGFQADVGVSLKGDSSAASPDAKHGFDIHFGSQYGVSQLNYPLFGANAAQSFEEIQLRTDQESSWSFVYPATFIGIRDEFTSSLLAAVGQPAEHYKVCFLYIDGMFWGLYDIIEKPNDDYAASYFGGSASGYDSIKPEGESTGLSIEAEEGTLTAWDELYTDISTLDLSNNANFQMIQGNNPDGTKNAAYPDLLDVNNLINYMLVIDYVGDTDGPYNAAEGPNNFYALRPTDGSFGFRFISTDSESTLASVDTNVVDLSPNTISSSAVATPAYFFGRLQANTQFNTLVGDAVQKDFFNGGPMTVSATTALFQSLATEVQNPVVDESARWGDTLRPGQAYTRDDDWQPLIDSMLSDYFPNRTQVVISQLQSAYLYPYLAAPTFSQYGGTISPGFQLTLSLSTAGTIYYTFDGSDPENADGSLSTAALSYSAPISLLTTTRVKARVFDSGYWSALVDETFVAPASAIRITELNYDPGKAPSGSSYNNDDYEFVELENFSSQSINLDGISFTDGVDYTFGNVTLGPWQSGVLVHNTAAFESRYGTDINIIGNYLSTGQSFSNSGENVELVDASGYVLDLFNYTSCVTAFPTAHGKGASLIVLNPTLAANLNLSTGWMASTVTNGSVPLLLGSTPTYIRLDADGQHIDIWNTATATGSPAQTLLTTQVTSITFTAAALADTLTVDFSNGNLLADAPLYFNGGSSPSSMTITGTANADTLTINASTLTFSTTSFSNSIAFANAANITFLGNGGANTLTQAAQTSGGTTFSFVSTSADTINVSAGILSLAASTAGVTPITLGTVSISSDAVLRLLTSTVAGNQNVLVVNNLSIAGTTGAWTGELDLGGNNLIVKGGDVATIADQLTEGFNSGLDGIASTAAAGANAFLTALGYNTGGNVFDGVSTTASDVVVKYTYFGDATLDGKVDGSDYSRIDNGYLLHLTGWINGDFNYDGVINGSDYTLIDNAFNTQGASLAAEIAAPVSKSVRSTRSSAPANAFQTSQPISISESSSDSIEHLMQAKDLVDRLNIAQ